MFDINTVLFFFFLLNMEIFKNESCCNFLMGFRIMPEMLALSLKQKNHVYFIAVYLILA